jgi:hypothetical protein
VAGQAKEDHSMIDRYTKVVLTVIALVLVGLLIRPSVAPRSVAAQQSIALCGSTPSAPCYVSVVGGPANLGAWQGGPVVILDSQRIAPRRY